MTDILTFDLEKIIENSIIELNKRIREDITNNLLSTQPKDYIYELDDIKDFGKLSDPTLSNIYNFIENKYSIYSNLELFPYHTDYLKLCEGEYPILMCNEISNSSGQIHYITNIIDGLMINNDDILFLILIAIKINKKRKQPIYRPCNTVIKYLKENKFINTELDNDYMLNNSLKRYFVNIHYNKIKVFEFDKLIKNNKILEDENYDIQEEKKILLDKIIKLEEENYIFFKELIELKKLNLEKQNKTYKEYYKNDEDKIIKLEEENNNLLDKIIKLEEENNNLLDKIIKLEETNSIYFKKITDFEEEYEQKKINENKTIIELNDKLFKTEKKLDKTKEKNNNLLEENNKLIETVNKVKEKNNQQKIITSNLIENNNKLVETVDKFKEKNNKEIKEKIYNIEKEHEKIIEENKNTNSLMTEISKDMKNMSNENIKTINERQKLIDKVVELMEEKNKLVKIINILSDKDIKYLILESDINDKKKSIYKYDNIQQILLDIKEERNNIHIENNRLKILNNKLETNENKLETNENNLLIDYEPIIKKYKKTQIEIISFYNFIICLLIFYLY